MPSFQPTRPAAFRRFWAAVLSFALLTVAPLALAQKAPIQLQVDATDAPRRILHARLQVPAQPGKLTLVYPKWIPGDHAPTGPIADLAGLKFSAAGHALQWQRDPEDMYAFSVEVPAGGTALEIALDYLSPAGADGSSSGASATAQLADISWNEVLLYPKGARAAEVQFAPSLRLPGAWKFGTALAPVSQEAGRVKFETVSLETLVDSPVIIGAHFRTLDLSPGATPPHFLHMVADGAPALELKPEDEKRFARLVPETGALFGARHYRSYHFLVTLSDHVAHFGLEHHESSDNREGEHAFIDEDLMKVKAGLLPHEMTHSWCGKYRRPAGLATPDYQQPMHDELLWVYEGLTSYLQLLLTVRCGLWTDDDLRQWLALEAAKLDYQPGRSWRPLADTAVAAQLLYGAAKEGSSWRRGVDFYREGSLIWLEADTVIRQQSQGRRSLGDFCRKFFGPPSGPPRVITYTREDVLAALNEIAPYHWGRFFQDRVYATTPCAPTGGIVNAGWRIDYTNSVPAMLRSYESAYKLTDLRFSLGLILGKDGAVQDVIPGSPADKAGVGPAMTILAVNGRRWTADLVRSATEATRTNTAPIELLVENDDYFKSCKVDYHEGERYPVLQRDASKPDLLSKMLKPLAPAK